MANSTAKALADDILNWYKGATFPAAPANLYAGLFSVTPTANVGSGTEITGSSYARVAIPSSGWGAISQSADTLHDQITNANPVNFPTVTGSPYTVNGIGVFDAASAGNLLDYQAVTPQAVSVGNAYQVAAGALAVEK